MAYYGVRGDYYGGRGDIWGTLGGIVRGGLGAIGGFATGGIGGAIAGAAAAFRPTGGGGGGTPGGAVSVSPVASGCAPLDLVCRWKALTGQASPGTAMTCGCGHGRGRGQHMNKSWLGPTRGHCGQGGRSDWTPPCSIPVTNRRMNPLNPRAAHRAIRRLRSFERISRHVVRFVSPKRAKGRAHYARGRRRSA